MPDGTSAALRLSKGTGQTGRAGGPRILLYSHDTFGLGHIRRTRTIAMALAEAIPGASILIVTGSPIVGRFDFPHGVDFVRVPGVVKLPTGDYASHTMQLDIAETIALREGLIEATVDSFRPDMLIVDKEPTGFRGELLGALEKLKERGAVIVLGVRDVLDDPEALAAEWERKQATAAIDRFYDHIWVYGLSEIHRPLDGLPLGPESLQRIRYTGYLRRDPPDWPEPSIREDRPEGFVLITPGGGGDGEALIDWALRAYESDSRLNVPAIIVFGPFLNGERKRSFERRAHRFRTIETLSFDSRIELLMIEATGIIAMGGYNTFCEILSFDKPACIAPRITPRREQFIRAQAAEAFGLVRMLPPPEGAALARDPALMADAIRRLASQPPPSAASIPRLLGGIERVVDLTREALAGVRA